ncbi:MAG: hypothetical protein JWM65_2064, partial [Sphingomonas bacterium]|nr:hypothetical protein [Sphingomonas bacterium]
SGAHYTLQMVPGADHMLDHIGARIQQAEGVSIGEKAARAFGISEQDRLPSSSTPAEAGAQLEHPA